MKKKQIAIGPGVSIDLDKLMTGRLLLQATSGAGKSWLLRRLLEQSRGLCQQIVIDPEGEFSTLREKFDYVLAAKQGGDTLADVRTAKLLAERLLELGVSAIIDIYELSPKDRVSFVKLFLEAMINAPKNLWHPVLVVIDEAHAFCPEQGDAESTEAVEALCTRGRKRGFCAVLATQRLPTLAKNAAAMCANKLIGRASLDIDIKRSGAELGMDAKAATVALRDLADGEFYAFGPAISKTVAKVKVGPVETTHPQAGSQLAARIPPPTDKVKALLPKLSDLPTEAADRERTTAEMKKAIIEKDRRIKELERVQPPSNPVAKQEVKSVPALIDADRVLLEKLTARIAELEAKIAKYQEASQSALDDKLFSAFATFIEGGRDRAIAHAEELKAILEAASVKKLLEKLNGLAIAPAPALSKPAHIMRTERPSPRPKDPKTLRPQAPKPSGSNGDESLPPAKRRILNALAFLEGIGIAEGERAQVAFLADARPRGGSFINNVSALKTAGFIDYPRQGFMALTEGGRAEADTTNVPQTSEELWQSLRAKLPPAKWKLVEAAISAYPEALSREELAQRAGAAAGGGSFINNVSALRTLGVIDYPRQGFVVATPVLFLEGR